ncbi:MAG: hypothetical protein NTZ29_16290 [Verrucomicrobia bacterium]|nr:hypothetical protein [Verrucomicrobiota bacterium]
MLTDIVGGNFPQPVTAAVLGRTVNFTQTVSAADVSAGRLWIPARYIRQLNTFPSANLNTQWDLTGKFTTGPAKHTFLLGTDADLGSNLKSGIPGVGGIEKQAYHQYRLERHPECRDQSKRSGDQRQHHERHGTPRRFEQKHALRPAVVYHPRRRQLQ